MFTESIQAYKYGPVVPEVYQAFKSKGAEKIQEKEKYYFKLKDFSLPPTIMKIYASDNSSEIFDSVKRVLKKYGKLDAGKLVDITHSEYSPWSSVYETNPKGSLYANNKITEEAIIKYHKNEKKILREQS